MGTNEEYLNNLLKSMDTEIDMDDLDFSQMDKAIAQETSSIEDSGISELFEENNQDIYETGDDYDDGEDGVDPRNLITPEEIAALFGEPISSVTDSESMDEQIDLDQDVMVGEPETVVAGNETEGLDGLIVGAEGAQENFQFDIPEEIVDEIENKPVVESEEVEHSESEINIEQSIKDEIAEQINPDKEIKDVMLEEIAIDLGQSSGEPIQELLENPIKEPIEELLGNPIEEPVKDLLSDAEEDEEADETEEAEEAEETESEK